MRFLLCGAIAAVTLPDLIRASDAAEVPCRVDEGPCEAAADGLLVVLDIAPRPVRAMRELLFSVTVRQEGRTVDDAEVTIELSMPGMDMGRNRIVLSARSNGRYEGAGTIVRCPSGGKRWKASVTITRGGSRPTADFLFEAH